MKVAFVAGLSDKKLKQKLAPLAQLPEIKEIHLYRRRPLSGIEKVTWLPLPDWGTRSRWAGDMLRFLFLMARGRRYDVLIGCNQAFHGVMASICGAVWRKPVVQIVTSGIEHICSHPLLKRTLLSAHAVAVRGPISLTQLRRQGYKKHIAILHNPWDRGSSPTNLPGIQPSYDLLAVGDYAAAKSYPWMMEVIGALKEWFPELRVAVAGKGPFRKKLSLPLDRHALKQCVSFLGWQDETALSGLYLKSRVLLLTSRTEGLPMVVIEAMTRKRAVIVTAVGDLPWLVRDGKDGFVVPHADTEGMVRILREMLSNPEKIEAMGRSAHDRIISLADEFKIKNISRVWKKLLIKSMEI